MSQARVVRLDDVQSVDELSIGSKAMCLVCLNKLGFPVPAGFCVTNKAFTEHLEQNNLIPHIKSELDKLTKAEPAGKKEFLSSLRLAIIDAPLSEETQQEIEKHYFALNTNKVAVRSSGTAEDLPDHSFAGQYDTYLGITNCKDCIGTVKKCWASLWTLRAYEYRERNGFDHLKINMAVIVQSLIASNSSGVIFTAHPVTGRRSNILIEACFGLGETLVSGKVTPDMFVVNKNNLKLLSRTISNKKIECAISDDGSAKEQTLTEQKSNSSTLNKKQIKQLAGLAKKIETEFGCPQDIEWAIYNKKIYLLQSRPITVIPQEKSWEDRQIWCNNPAKEVIPDVVTPITSSVIEAMLDNFMSPLFRVLCMDRGDHPIYGFVAGRLYFNANIWGAVFRNLPKVEGLDTAEFTGSHKGLRQVAERLKTASEEELPDLKFKRIRFTLKIPLMIIGILRNTPEKGLRILTNIRTSFEKWSHLNVASLSTEQITTRCKELIADFRDILGHVMYLFSALAALPVLDMACTRWLKDDNINTGMLLAGLGDMADAIAGLDLWRLALKASASTETKDLISSNDNWDMVESKLSESGSGKEFLKTWVQFMSHHGHHCRGEIELYNQRWAEMPDYILKLVRNYIAQIGKIDPVQNHAELTQQRLQLEQKCRRRLKNPIKRMIFNLSLVRSQKGSVFRENVKSEVIKLLTTMRKMLLELGKRLWEKGVFENQDDIFFLYLDEIEPVVQGKADFDIHQVITARRAEYNKNCSITPPDVVFGKFDPDNFVPDTRDEQAEVLNGLAVSPGVATGKARVILRADTEEQLLAGEILVAPFTDPGWTPYFVPAVAIVMDQGGTISHGSIVAREYGIPAVVNVEIGTKVIKTGQTIQVDGNTGVVRILE